MSTDTFTRVAFPSLGFGGAAPVDAVARSTGHAAGYLEGLRAGAAVAKERAEENEIEVAQAAARTRARIDAAVATLTRAADALERRTLPLLGEVQTAIAEAAVDIAEAVIGHELSCGDASARSALGRALGGVDVERVIAIRLNPDDLADLTLASPAASALPPLTLVADATLSRGDAVTEFDEGFLDARIGSALERVRSALAVSP